MLSGIENFCFRNLIQIQCQIPPEGDTASVIKESRGAKNMILADGPAGLRLQPHFKTDKDGNILPGGEGFNGTFLPFKDRL